MWQYITTKTPQVATKPLSNGFVQTPAHLQAVKKIDAGYFKKKLEIDKSFLELKRG